MKKYIIYIGVLAIGILLGWFLFGNPSDKEQEHNHAEVIETNQLWTCSMHPQIMQPEPGDCPICGMDLIPSIMGDEGLSASQFKLSKNALALANVQTTVVGDGSETGNTFKLSGRIIENEETNAVQVSYFSGRIEKLNVNSTGTQVRKGQLLASIYSPELMTAQQELITAASLKSTQPDLYNAVRNKLKLWKLSEAQIEQIEASKQVKENFEIYATVSGTVLTKMIEQGDHVKQGQALFKIADLSSVWAIFDVYENQMELFGKGQDISIATNAHPGKIYKAKVSFIDPILDQQSRTLKLRVVLPNSQNDFKPGMFVEGEIEGIASKHKKAIQIPSSSILWTGKRSVVYLKTDPNNPVFEMLEVELGKDLGNSYEVLQGLNPGDEIVTNGTFTIDAAAQLQGKKSMMNKEGGTALTGHEGHGDMPTNNKNKQPIESAAHKRVVVRGEFKQQLHSAFEAYMGIKDALVKDDMANAKQYAGSMLNSLDQVDMKLITDTESQRHWKEVEKQMRQAAATIESIDDIKAQRTHFKELSKGITSAIQMYGIGQVVYNQFCPMADDNRGAYWLSNEKNVLNPYFGDAMLACGSVKQIITE